MPLLLLGSALASPWDGKDPDVRAEAVVSASPEQVYAVLTDLKLLRKATPETCVGRWELGTKTVGPGSTATVRYDMAAMHRNLVMALTNAEPSWKVEFEHAGNTGFITQWTLTVEGGGTKVSMTSLLEAPPWPFKAYYYETVQPTWAWCQAQMIAGVGRLAAEQPAPPTVDTQTVTPMVPSAGDAAATPPMVPTSSAPVAPSPAGPTPGTAPTGAPSAPEEEPPARIPQKP
jgi:uncharacterized protein YndB with AHSA1/START domain